MRKLRWSIAAANDLEQIRTYLRLNYPSSAMDTLQLIYDAARSLRQFPEKGRRGRVEGTRELVLSPLPYLIVYSLSVEHVQVLRILHGAQEFV